MFGESKYVDESLRLEWKCLFCVCARLRVYVKDTLMTLRIEEPN